MGLGGDAAERQRLFRHADDARGAVGELDILRRDFQILGGHRPDLVGDQPRGLADGVDHHGGKPVRVVARRQRPRAGQRIDLRHHVDVVGGEAERVGRDLRGDRLVSLPGRRGDRLDGNGTGRIDGYGAGSEPSGPAARAGALLRRLGERHIGHVGTGRLDRRRDPDAEQPPFVPRPVPPGAQLFVAGKLQRPVEPGLVIAGVIDRARRRAVGERIARYEIAPPDLGDVDAERPRAGVHGALEREEELRPPIAPVEADRQPVCRHQPVVDIYVADPVGTVRRAVHPVDGRRLGRADIGTDIDDIEEFETDQRAVISKCRLDGILPVGRRRRAHQMLQPVLDPFERHAEEPARGGEQHHIGVHPLLDAEAAAALRRGDQAQPVARHPERTAHQGVQDERPLEIGPDRVAVGRRLELRDRAVGLHRSRGIAWEGPVQPDHAVGLRERGFRVAVAETAMVDDVGAHRLVQQRRVAVHGGIEVHHRGQRPVFDLDQLERILGDVAVLGGDQRHRLTRIAHLVDRHRVVVDRHADRARDGPGRGRNVDSGDDSMHTGVRDGIRNVYRNDVGMGVGRAQQSRVAEPRHRLHVVDEARVAGKEGLVLLARDRGPDPAAAFGHRAPRAAAADR